MLSMIENFDYARKNHNKTHGFLLCIYNLLCHYRNYEKLFNKEKY